MNQQYPSALLEKAIGEFSKLPGVGKKLRCDWSCIFCVKIPAP